MYLKSSSSSLHCFLQTNSKLVSQSAFPCSKSTSSLKVRVLFQHCCVVLNRKFVLCKQQNLTYYKTSWYKRKSLKYLYFSWRDVIGNFFCQGFFFTVTSDLEDNKASKEGEHLYSFLPLPPAHEHSGIYLGLCIWDDYLLFLIASKNNS